MKGLGGSRFSKTYLTRGFGQIAIDFLASANDVRQIDSSR
jgi:hypothetical protein